MDTLLGYLAALVGMPTITADIAANEAALAYAAGHLEARGMYLRRYEFEGHPTIVASTRPDNYKFQTVCLSAHIDVVAGDESVFTMRKEGGKVYGRGVYDMKFAIAGYLQLVNELATEGTLADYDFSIMLTADEEATPGVGLSGVSHLIDEGYRPKVALLPDSTAPGWDIEKIAKGWWRFELISKGKSVHSSRPWEGESASLKLVHALHELKGLFKDPRPEVDTLNISTIHGEAIYNQVPDQMVAKVEIRLCDEASLAKWHKLVAELCKRHGISFKDFSTVLPVRPLLDNKYVDAYKDAVERVAGKRPQGVISLGGSDAPYFTKAGVPCILSCPNGGRHHSDQEWMEIASLQQFVPILREFLEKTAHQPAARAPVDKKQATGVK